MHYWKDPERVERLKQDYRSANLNDVDEAWCELAWKLTMEPGALTNDDHLKALRELGQTDQAILDATLIISYFNFVNRLVMGLGVQLEEGDGAGGYEY